MMNNEPLISELCTNYPIGKWISLMPLSKGCSGEIYHLVTTRGQYILHKFSSKTTIPSMTFEQNLIRHLFFRGFPVSEPVLTHSGQAFVVGQDGFYTLGIYIPGELGEYGNREHLVEAAKALAWYHRLVGNYPAQEQRDGFHILLHQIRESAALIPPATSDGRIGLIERLPVAGRIKPALMEAVLYMRAQANTVCQELESVPYGSLLQLVIHGDFHRRNLCFEGGQLKGVLSFSNAHIDTRASDLAFALWRFALVRWDPHSPGYKVWLDADLIEAFVHAYREAGRIEDMEIRMIPELIRAHTLRRALCHYFPRLREEPAGPWATKLPRDARALRWLDANRVRILDALC